MEGHNSDFYVCSIKVYSIRGQIAQTVKINAIFMECSTKAIPEANTKWYAKYLLSHYTLSYRFFFSRMIYSQQYPQFLKQHRDHPCLCFLLTVLHFKFSCFLAYTDCSF